MSYGVGKDGFFFCPKPTVLLCSNEHSALWKKGAAVTGTNRSRNSTNQQNSSSELSKIGENFWGVRVGEEEKRNGFGRQNTQKGLPLPLLLSFSPHLSANSLAFAVSSGPRCSCPFIIEGGHSISPFSHPRRLGADPLFPLPILD
jgi:hypothetical protein